MPPKSQLPILHSATELELRFPKPNAYITPEDSAKTRELIQGRAMFTPDGKPFIPSSALPHLLATDRPGANKFYNDLPDGDKMRNGTERLVAAPALNKELSRQIQEPRDVYKIERLKYSEACLIALRDAPELEKLRLLEESRIRKDVPKLKGQMLKEGSISACQASGEPLEPDAEVHHIERRADQPSMSLDPSNLLLVNKDPHREIHEAGAHSPGELTALAEKKGWPYRSKR